MKINRDIKDIVNDLDLIIKEVSKLDAIERLIGRKNWYDHDTFIEHLENILEGWETED